MATKDGKTGRGMTLIELMVALVIVVLLMIAVGETLVDAQNAWGTMYKRSNSGPVVDAVILNKEFDRVVRKATKSQWSIDGTALSMATGTASLQVYYYKNPSNLAVTSCDGYSKFYYVAGEKRLKVDEGDLTPGTWTPTGTPTTRTIADNVQGCEFRVVGDSVEMVVRLDAGQNTDPKDGNVKMTVTCSAVRHNL